jgi:hypothetical protein
MPESAEVMRMSLKLVKTKHTNKHVDEVYRLLSVNTKTKGEGMNHGCNGSLNVFQPTLPLL